MSLGNVRKQSYEDGTKKTGQCVYQPATFSYLHDTQPECEHSREAE